MLHSMLFSNVSCGDNAKTAPFIAYKHSVFFLSVVLYLPGQMLLIYTSFQVITTTVKKRVTAYIWHDTGVYLCAVDWHWSDLT